MTINFSEIFPIVDYQLSNTKMCVCVMISGWFYTPPTLVMVWQKIRISGSVFPLWKKKNNKTKQQQQQQQKTASKSRQQSLSIVPLSAAFSSQMKCVVWHHGLRVADIVMSKRFKEILSLNMLSFISDFFYSKEVTNSVPGLKLWLYVWRPCEVTKR